MTATRLRHFCVCVIVACLLAAPAEAAIVVYDLGLDFSDTVNPNGVWSFAKGSTLLTHYTPVPTSLAPALANGYWGTSASNLNSSVMLSTAGGSAAPPLTNFDFIAGEVLVGTTDASTGGPVDIHWTAPSNGTLTYSGWVWYADPTAGPFGNSFDISLNNGPSIEYLTASIGQHFFNSVPMLNGLVPIVVTAGDVLTLTVSPLVPVPTPLIGGVSWTIDFTPVPEPSSWFLMGVGLIAVAMFAWTGVRSNSKSDAGRPVEGSNRLFPLPIYRPRLSRRPGCAGFLRGFLTARAKSRRQYRQLVANLAPVNNEQKSEMSHPE